ncbi:AMP-binding protein [Nocardioides marmoriginsengisoli]|uniref:AMP-binding protein n=1 Tax=Nocardioides marmoriginsengisoli TaxID=661483 RepID=UPI001C831AFE|nr:AMP-binding protein [Nocardioides marmoriginsengisoli]
MSLADKVRSSAIVARANTTLPERPDRLPRAMLAALPYGRGTLGAVAASCHRYPEATAVVGADESLTYRELWRTSKALANGLADVGVGPDSTVGILSRNSPFFVQTVVAGLMLGADLVFLNTGFGQGQLAEVAVAEQLSCIVHDDEATGLVRAGPVTLNFSRSEVLDLIAKDKSSILDRPSKSSRLVVLTSGTTGRPQGAARSSRSGPDGIAALLGRVPMRLRDTIVIPAPFFHAWGLANLLIGLGLSATVVSDPKFDP